MVGNQVKLSGLQLKDDLLLLVIGLRFENIVVWLLSDWYVPIAEVQC